MQAHTFIYHIHSYPYDNHRNHNFHCSMNTVVMAKTRSFQYTQLNTQHSHGCIRLQSHYYTLSVTPGTIESIYVVNLSYHIGLCLAIYWNGLEIAGELLWQATILSSEVIHQRNNSKLYHLCVCIQIICIYILSTIFHRNEFWPMKNCHNSNGIGC